MNYKPKRGDMELWLICVATASDLEKSANMKHNSDGTYTVKFEVGGVDLDFSAVAKRIEDSIDFLVESKAQQLLDAKYGRLINEINNIQERLKDQKETLFRYDWEEK